MLLEIETTLIIVSTRNNNYCEKFATNGHNKNRAASDAVVQWISAAVFKSLVQQQLSIVMNFSFFKPVKFETVLDL